MDRRIEQVLGIIEREYGNHWSLSRIATAVHLSPSRLEHLFRLEMRTTYQSYVKEWRLTKAKDLLEKGVLSVKQIASQVGFSYPRNLAHAFKIRFGKTPSQCRQGGTGVNSEET